MNDTPLRTITLNSESLEAAIDVLSSAAASFGLTRRARTGYRALMVSVDFAIVSLAVIVLSMCSLIAGEAEWLFGLLGLGGIAFVVSSVGGAFAFLLNLPLFRRTLQERARLKTLGVTALSESLWKASRRHDWLSRIRSALIVFFGVLIALLASVYLVLNSVLNEAPLLAVFLAVVAVMLFGARHLRNQREQMDLAANAVELQKALRSLRQQAGATGTIAVPAELVERVAKIESAQIARKRKEAILQSAGSQASGYAITFEDKAAEQRAALDVRDRLELEDLLADLSTARHRPEAYKVLLARSGAGSRGTTQSKRVEVEYAIDQESRVFRITAVKRVADEAGRAMAGASDA